MSQALPIAVLFAFLVSGVVIAKTGIAPPKSFVDRAAEIFLYLLLFFMGVRIGRSEEAMAQIGEIGVTAVTFALATVIGTVVVLVLIYTLTAYLERRKAAEVPRGIVIGTVLTPRTPEAFNYGYFAESDTHPRPGPAPRFVSHLIGPARLFAAVLLGFAAGVFIPLFPELTGESLSSWSLRILLLLIGAQLVQSGVNVKAVLVRIETALLPLGTILGSLAGGLAAALILGIRWNRALAVASGFGWYSLSGVIITDMGDPVLGSAAFLGNIMRETIALVSIPFIAQTAYPAIGIGVAGATAMDVSLPLIDRSCGPEAVPLAIASGAILSLLVPVLVPLFYGMG